MKPEIKKLWLEGLRSDQFVQGRIYLKATDHKVSEQVCHCGLGVLGQLAVNAGVALEIVEQRVSNRWDIYSFRDVNHPDMEDHGYLPHAVQTWSGLYAEGRGVRHGDILLRINGVTQSFTWWNDVAKLTFAQLADAIEAYY
jgi:hypothetical protein